MVTYQFVQQMFTNIDPATTNDCIWFNSLASGDFDEILYMIFEFILVTDGEYLSRTCSQMNVTGPFLWYHDKSTLVKVMAWCRQVTSHYLSQSWPKFMSPYGVTWPQWLKTSYFRLLMYGQVVGYFYFW